MTTLNESIDLSTDSATPTPAPEAPKKEKKAPTSGQSGPKLVLDKEGLNGKEVKVVEALLHNASPVAIITLAATCFEGEATPKANSWVRNSMRRLVRAGWVDKVGSGTYLLSEEGRTKYTAAS